MLICYVFAFSSVDVGLEWPVAPRISRVPASCGGESDLQRIFCSFRKCGVWQVIHQDTSKIHQDCMFGRGSICVVDWFRFWTANGRNPAPPGMYETLSTIG